MLEHGRMKSNDFSKSSRTDYYSESSDYYSRVESKKRYGIATFPSEPLGSPVNPHDVVKGGY